MTDADLQTPTTNQAVLESASENLCDLMSGLEFYLDDWRETSKKGSTVKSNC